MSDEPIDLAGLRHDHHGCRLCVRQRAEAADEIERLRAENKRLDIVTDEQVLLIEHQEAKIERLRAKVDRLESRGITGMQYEIEQLRAALTEIAEFDRDRQVLTSVELARIARRALEP